MTTRTVPEIENDLVTVDQALATVSEIRSSLHQFTRLIQTERKTPNFVYQFSDRLNTIKRELNRLSTAGENLKGNAENLTEL
ncbi:uncharacterized protein BYT42DRAFT_500534 [Radiomyces spectabilis]|uniref:uncharacterized protein n=1 Tax=Radiomyces spectabilis TaxID=64574 RepID=UPI002220DE60|nr:uncharacterized protein BYT42DRAFT_500534 [Radiomyces spectabilis]KAI8373069.1 hypothetical protein BYT42DRAFT_500534 [Radiomyces spectabilis]